MTTAAPKSPNLYPPQGFGAPKDRRGHAAQDGLAGLPEGTEIFSADNHISVADDIFYERFPEELKGYYLAGDGAVRSVDRGYFRITGRIDDVLNVSGHRMGTMEIESALVGKTDLVAEAAVVGRPDDLTGEAIVAFVVLKRSRPTGDEAKAIAKVLRDWVGKEIGPIAKPKDIRFGDNLPKTRSGKIMRRLLRSIAKGEAITQDTSTLENPAILDQLSENN